MHGKSEIDRFLQGAVDRNEVPAVVAMVANKDQILYHHAFGKRDVANQDAMRTDSIFDIMSMTKPVTSVAVMMLREEGKLDLDDPISAYLPALKAPDVLMDFNGTESTYRTVPAAREITIRHLLAHSAGFGYNFSNRTVQVLEQSTGKPARDLPLLHEPGSRWTYGLNTRILGELVVELSGMPLAEFFQVRIFDPLGMAEIGYILRPENYNRWVTVHRRKAGVLVEQPRPEIQQPDIFGDYGLLSTAGDYITFLQMFLQGGTLHGAKILNEDSIALMAQNQIGDLVVEIQGDAIPALASAFPLGAGQDKFGLGFQIRVTDTEPNRLRSAGSLSWSGLKNTHFWVDPQAEIAAVILMQVLPFYDDACIRVFQGFEELVYRNFRDQGQYRRF